MGSTPTSPPRPHRLKKPSPVPAENPPSGWIATDYGPVPEDSEPWGKPFRFTWRHWALLWTVLASIGEALMIVYGRAGR